ncbi:MAG: stage II sporulation protein R [Oscillospiraceae bacterium]
MVKYNFMKDLNIEKLVNKVKNNMLEISVLASIIICVIIGAIFTTFENQTQDIRENTLRLHIKANSDSDIDQGLKLKVRDEVIKQTQDVFNKVDTKENVKTTIEENVQFIQQIAQKKVLDEGYDYKVTSKVDNIYFNTRYYENFTMPAGYYDALSLDIGEGDGENWWCVLFPPLCLPSATYDTDENVLRDNFEEEQVDIITNSDKYQFKFALLEFFYKIYEIFI